MSITLSVTNLSTGPMPIPTMGLIAPSDSKSKEFNSIDLDPLLPGLDRAARAGWLTYSLSPNARSTRTFVSAGGAPSPDTTNAAIEEYLMINEVADSVTVNLPTAVGCAGKKLTVKRLTNTALRTVLIDPNGTEQIDGAGAGVALTVPAAVGQTVVLVSDGAGWQSIQSEQSP